MKRIKLPYNSNSTTSSASPSVTLEKGAFRLRAPANRPYLEQPVFKRRKDLRNDSNDYLIALVFLLGLACLTSFCAAYYLFTTRWDASVFKNPANSMNEVTAFDGPSVLEPHPQHNEENVPLPGEKYLAYLPHSGFHNQRIALENALTLARLLNRTLILPPVRLGTSLRYLPFDALLHHTTLSGKDGLWHCSGFRDVLLPECLAYSDYTFISWTRLVDLDPLRSQQRLIERWNFSASRLPEYLGIPEDGIRIFNDSDPYQFRFLDTLSDVSPISHKFKESIYIPELALSPPPLIQIGTLFGTSRLRLKDPTNVAVRTEVRKRMCFNNPILLQTADSISQKLGSHYLGAHVRVGDGQFKINDAELSRTVWRNLVMQTLNLTIEETDSLEEAVEELSTPSPILSTRRAPFLPTRRRCRGTLHNHPHLTPLNVPLYISTDARDPMTDPSLSIFTRLFPCTFFLEDFPEDLSNLDGLRSEYDGLRLKDFLRSMLDAIVAGKASTVVGTEGSTFSAFVHDVLWTAYHGKEIIQKG